MQLDPEALETIINKKAEEFTDADIDALIEHFRKERANFVVAEATKTRPRRPAVAVDPNLASLLDDL